MLLVGYLLEKILNVPKLVNLDFASDEKRDNDDEVVEYQLSVNGDIVVKTKEDEGYD